MEYFPANDSADEATISIQAPLTGDATGYPLVLPDPLTSSGEGDDS